jgi:hypothetical protein
MGACGIGFGGKEESVAAWVVGLGASVLLYYIFTGVRDPRLLKGQEN